MTLTKKRERIMPNKIYKSEDILGNEDILSEVWEKGEISYQLADGELQWLDYIHGKYSIADYIENNSDTDEDDNVIVVMNQNKMIKALDEDNNNAGKAVMLADDTALQAIFFYGYQEKGGEEDE